MKKKILIGIGLFGAAIIALFATPFFPFDEILLVIAGILTFIHDIMK